jgi:hypothetical protein
LIGELATNINQLIEEGCNASHFLYMHSSVGTEHDIASEVEATADASDSSTPAASRTGLVHKKC